MFDDLPDGIVAQMAALGHGLLAVIRAHRDAPLATLEQETLGTLRAAMPAVLGAVLQASTSSLQPGGAGRTAACPRCGERRPVAAWRRRTCTTVCGTLTIERP